MDSRVGNKKHKKRKKWPFWVGGIVLALILIGATTIALAYNKVQKTVASMHEPLERDKDPKRQKELDKKVEDQDAINVLLLGIDERSGDKGRSDTMILMSVNPNTQSTLMLSIPRDTYVNIPGRGMDKINHAYAFGDVALSIETVENAFDLPVHFYARVNMDGFEQGIDAIGGVTVNNDIEFDQGGYHFPTGQINLDGSKALEYTRMRKRDPRGDMGRNDRQRQVVAAAMDEIVSFSSVTKIGNILDILGGNVKTNLDMDKLKSLFFDYRKAVGDIETMEIAGTGETINSIWYYIVQDEEFARIKNEITEHMEAR